jgi:GTP-binding protein
LKITAEFVTSAASAADLPHAGLPRIALVGRSNVGKSSLINALVRTRLARTSADPGKTRLANVYRVQRGAGAPANLIDLPGFGFARGGSEGFEQLASGVVDQVDAAVLVVDARHPGLENDRAAWRWLRETVPEVGIAGTKIDKLARGERIRALRELESVFQHPVLPVSAVTGEGLDELWRLIERLATPRQAQGRPEQRRGTNSSNNSSSRRNSPPAAGTAPRPRTKSSESTWRRSKT